MEADYNWLCTCKCYNFTILPRASYKFIVVYFDHTCFDIWIYNYIQTITQKNNTEENNMKKAITVLMLLVMCLPIALASTTINTNWDGSGTFETHWVAGDDATSDFWTAGHVIIGSFSATDSDNNPYGYGVDSTTSQVEAQVGNGGYMEFVNTRTDSKSSAYGDAGEVSYTYIESSDAAGLNFRTSSNYASMTNSQYGFHSSNHFSADGDFVIQHSLYDDTDEGAWIMNTGSGTTNIDLMCESTWGKTGSFQFGKGCGCYTNADVLATGAGYFEVGAVADNQIDADVLPFTIYGDETSGSARYELNVNYGNGFNFGNFALSGN